MSTVIRLPSPIKSNRNINNRNRNTNNRNDEKITRDARNIQFTFNQSLINDIYSTIALYNSDQNNKVELEARLGYFTNNRFNSSVNTRSFFGLLNKLRNKGYTLVESSDTVKSYREEVTDPVNPNKRTWVTTRQIIDDTTDNVIWEQKVKPWNYDIKSLGIRLAIATERPINPLESFHSQSTRSRHRYSFHVSSNRIRIDLTEVRMMDGNKNTSTYEVEVEALSLSQNFIPNYVKVINMVYRELHGTKLIYTFQEREQFINYFNTLLASNIPPRRTDSNYGCNDPSKILCPAEERVDDNNVLENRVLVHARNLKNKDIVWGGLVGNSKTAYRVTHKADGLRKLMVFAPNGIWIVMPPNEIMWIASGIGNIDLVGTVIEGELLSENDIKNFNLNTALWMLFFDCLAWKGSTSIQNNTHTQRMNAAQIVSDAINAIEIPEGHNRLIVT
ncbi:MAG: hypothetical protein KC414_14970, partial [Romboutsia sp.]|nr:hypothetical protein [Romboutsia sp.]